jgi:hypothetical protein
MNRTAQLPTPIHRADITAGDRVHLMPTLIAAAGGRASMRFLEFFTANIRNPHTRRAYARAAEEFLISLSSSKM